MPFVQANNRDQAALTKFFEDHLKQPIEDNKDLNGKFEVARSSDDFLILDNILLDLANSDMVICDLSGTQANPNVIYELGIRFSVSHKPVILIREQAESNKSMFDVAGLHTFHYNMNDTKTLERHIVKKVKEYDEEPAKYTSPVLKILNHEAAFWMQLPIRKASAFLGGIASAAEANLSAFAKAVNNHLRKKGDNDFLASPVTTIYKSIEAYSSSPEIFDDFDYHISSIPSLDSYLSSVYLLGLVEESVEKSFRTYAMNYSLYFNRNNSRFFWATRFDEAHAYAMETLILMNLCRMTINILKAKPDSQDRKNLVVSLNDQLKNSEFGAI
ncbi:hypothetical protein GCM10025794_00790 [Massilia kyonggiensis]